MKIALFKETMFGNKTAVAVELDVCMTGKGERILFSGEKNTQIIINKLLAYQLESVYLKDGEELSFEKTDKEKHYWIRHLTEIDRQRILYQLYRDYNEGVAVLEFALVGNKGTFSYEVSLPESFDVEDVKYDFSPIEISLDTTITLNGNKLKDLILNVPSSLDLEYFGGITNMAELVTAKLARLISDKDGIKYSIEDWDNLSSKHRKVIATAFDSLPAYNMIIDVVYEGETFKHLLNIDSFFTIQGGS